MNQTINLKTLSTTELKAFKSDIYENLERMKMNLITINAEIELRAEEQAKKDAEEAKKEADAKALESAPEIPMPHEEINNQ